MFIFSCISCDYIFKFNINEMDLFSGEPLYVARARHESDLIPGKLVPSHNVAYVAYGGGEHPHSDYGTFIHFFF